MGATGMKDIHGMPWDAQVSLIESMADTGSRDDIGALLELFDDPDIRLRGEAFGALVLNRNNITQMLVAALDSPCINIRAFTALVHGNRRETSSIAALERLTSDPSSLVRSCALGALGHMRAHGACAHIRARLDDLSMQVRRSALMAAVDAGCEVSEDVLSSLSGLDDELDLIVRLAGRRMQDS